MIMKKTGKEAKKVPIRIVTKSRFKLNIYFFKPSTLLSKKMYFNAVHVSCHEIIPETKN